MPLHGHGLCGIDTDERSFESGTRVILRPTGVPKVAPPPGRHPAADQCIGSLLRLGAAFDVHAHMRSSPTGQCSQRATEGAYNPS